MRTLAEKLMNLRGIQKNSSVPSAIFGTAAQTSASLNNVTPQFRVGMWPAISQEDPLAAMGLMTALAALLEQYRQVTVYRLFVKLDGEPSAYQWDISQSQFEFEDWHPESLDDNIGIWGELHKQGQEWLFSIEIENDLSTSDDPLVVSKKADSLNSLVNLLPEIVDEIADNLRLEKSTMLNLYSTKHSRDNEQIRELLLDWFHWEVHLLLSLWGRAEDTSNIFERLVNNSWRFDDEFGVWALTQAFTRILLPGFADVEAEIPPFEEIIQPFNAHPLSSSILSRALYAAGRPKQAVTLLEESVASYQQNPRSWVLLADLYRRSGDFLKAVDTYQRAIEIAAVSSALYVNYAQLLPLMETAGYEVEEFILIEPDELSENYMSWEAVEAYEAAMSLGVERAAVVLAAQALLLVDIADTEEQDERLWRTFQALVSYDQEGDAVRQVVESFYNLEEIERGLDILEDALEQNPERVDLRINLALAYIAAEESEYALTELDQAYELTKDPQLHGEIERLMLVTQNAGFETAISEIADKVHAGSSPNLDELEFLESVMERAPQYLEPYLLLAKGHLLRDDIAAALETLLDAQKRFPTDPDILDALAGVLLDTGEYETALEYIQKGLNLYPDYVPLLVRMGQYRFDEDNWEQAKVYLARAETIEPKSPALARVRAYISKELSEDDSGF